eukprot:TRINITY_DN94859_c0_g1_i1.p1 TRINITY_DN94859_c0_g1~~TRINITY_DN94859_c0_g1_i1.p1  ORF type:complete len:337 (+),score=29.37 TRINITY_DN94859_c0_g1_i1:107-1012(+)
MNTVVGKVKPSQSHHSFPTSASPPTSPGVDNKNARDPLHCTTYVKDIYDHLRATESKTRPSSAYMNKQTDINDKMRCILIDWLIDVHLKFKMKPETLHLSVDIVDRYLDKQMVTRAKLQLIGVVGMLLASKYEEIYPPEVRDFIYISANTYTRDEILRMERTVLAALDFNLTVPTIYPFLIRDLQVMDADKVTSCMAKYFSELALVAHKMIAHQPSITAAACVYLANRVMGAPDPWPPVMVHYTHYKIQHFKQCAKDLVDLIVSAVSKEKTQAARKKYSSKGHFEVARTAGNAKLEEIEIP